MKLARLFTVFLLTAVLLLTSSCKEVPETGTSSGEDVHEVSTSSDEDLRTSEQETETESEASSESTEERSGMETETAKRYGITEENYPVLDGSTSTFSIVLGLFNTFFDYINSAEGCLKAPETPSRTVPSYRKLIRGEADMIFVPYASSAVLQEAADSGVLLEFHRISAEALVFITHEDNETENITREQVREIYLNDGIRNWKALGGPDKELVPICRNADSGSQSQMDNLILDNEAMDPEILDNYQMTLMWDVLEVVANYQTGGPLNEYKLNRDCYALGYSLFTYVENAVNDYEMSGLKYLAYEGVLPTAESIVNGTYPLSDGYYAVLRADTSADHPTRRILQYLQSEEGQKMLDEKTLMLPAGEDSDDAQAGYLDPDSEEQTKKNEAQRARDLAELSELLKRYGWESELNSESWMTAADWLITHREELIDQGIPEGRIDYYYTMLIRMNLSQHLIDGN